MTSAYIPSDLLARWLLFVSSLAIFNCAQNYLDHSFSRKVYTKGGAQVTPLSARTFGIWNLASAMIRLYAAYDIHNKAAYDLCMGSFAIALLHFTSEVLIYRTAKLTPGIISPLVVASSSLGAMWLKYSDYVR